MNFFFEYGFMERWAELNISATACALLFTESSVLPLLFQEKCLKLFNQFFRRLKGQSVATALKNNGAYGAGHTRRNLTINMLPLWILSRR